jgi:hypothetical protein
MAITIEVSEKEKRLIEEIRNYPYSEMNVIVLNKEPIRIEKIVESVKL